MMHTETLKNADHHKFIPLLLYHVLSVYYTDVYTLQVKGCIRAHDIMVQLLLCSKCLQCTYHYTDKAWGGDWLNAILIITILLNLQTLLKPSRFGIKVPIYTHTTLPVWSAIVKVVIFLVVKCTKVFTLLCWT